MVHITGHLLSLPEDSDSIYQDAGWQYEKVVVLE
jgi:hypothetical protein